MIEIARGDAAVDGWCEWRLRVGQVALRRAAVGVEAAVFHQPGPPMHSIAVADASWMIPTSDSRVRLGELAEEGDALRQPGTGVLELVEADAAVRVRRRSATT